MKLGRLNHIGVATVVALAIMMITVFVKGVEHDLDTRRRQLVDKDVYWQCDQVPPDPVLARVYASKMIFEQHPNWKYGFKWAIISASYTTYLRFRLDHDELIEAFLKTPSLLEKGCEQVVGGNI
jgi:hypothetical protein